MFAHLMTGQEQVADVGFRQRSGNLFSRDDGNLLADELMMVHRCVTLGLPFCRCPAVT